MSAVPTRSGLLLVAVLAMAALGAGLWLAARGGEEVAEARPEAPAPADTASVEQLAAPAPVPPGQGAHPVHLFGRITMGGEPAAVQISVHPLEGRDEISGEVDARGNYELVVPRHGLHFFSIQLEEEVVFNLSAKIVGPGKQCVDVEIPPGAIEGHVRGPDGPVSGLLVYLQGRAEDDAWTAHAKATTDEHGRYAVERLPAGSWAIRAVVDTVFQTAAMLDHVLVAGGQRTVGVDLYLLAAGSLSGRVLTPAGAPAVGARLHLQRSTGEALDAALAWDETDPEGRFAIGRLEPGSYTLVALGQSESAEIQVRVEPYQDAEVELRTVPATLVRVLVRAPVGNPRVACRRSDGVECTTWVNGFDAVPTQGEQHFGPLPAGTYTFSVDGLPPSSQTVILEDEREILLVL